MSLEESVPSVSRPIGRVTAETTAPRLSRRRPKLEFFNGFGGFANAGREYVTILGEGPWTPAPWINVIANPAFGFQTSVEGGGSTWAINSRQHQLTPWSNDAVSDRPGEVLYVLHDEDDGAVWTPTALPIREEAGPYVVSHGQGYSRFEHVSHGISLALLQYVPPDDPIKICAVDVHEPVRPTTAAVDHRLRGMGARRVARRDGAVRRDGDRSRDARDARTQSLEHRLQWPCGVRRSRRTSTVLDG